jgi:hypothetical protein
MNKLGRKKAIVYGLVLLVAVIGLVLDRMLYAPADAKADDGLPAASTSAQKPAEKEAKLISGPQVASIFEKNDEDVNISSEHENNSTGSESRDVFALSKFMQGYYQSIQNNVKGESEEEKIQKNRDEMINSFRSSHSLQATFIGGGDTYALIDGRVMCVGDKLDGFSLQEIKHYRVKFSKKDMQIDLYLPLPFESKVPSDEQR